MKKGDMIWGLSLAAIVAFLTVPATNRLFTAATAASPYLMGFVKFAVLATMGETLANRIASKKWEAYAGLMWKAVVWGVVGVLIVLMFQIFPAGVAGAAEKGYLFSGSGWPAAFIAAFLSSLIMNLTFGPVFMAVHRISDSYLDHRRRGVKLKLGEVIERVDWPGFIKFVIAKTIPFFWLPMHTISFLLPADYRVLFAAFLSIALGAILAYAKRREKDRDTIRET
jgi:hypothetical protein